MAQYDQLNAQFPQVQFLDMKTGAISLQWLRWLQNLDLQVSSIAEFLLISQATESTPQAALSNLSQQIASLQNEISAMTDQSAQVAALGKSLQDTRVELASVLEPNLGPLMQKMNDIEIAGIFK